MTMVDILNKVIEQEGLTKTELAKRMGISRQALSKMMKQQDIRVSTVIKIIRPLGYEFIIEKRRNHK